MDIKMDITVKYADEDGKKIEYNIDKIKFHKMMFLYNAINEGWTIKKRSNSYYFTKNHEGKKEIFSDIYLSTFMKDHFDINKILSSNDR